MQNPARRPKRLFVTLGAMCCVLLSACGGSKDRAYAEELVDDFMSRSVNAIDGIGDHQAYLASLAEEAEAHAWDTLGSGFEEDAFMREVIDFMIARIEASDQLGEMKETVIRRIRIAKP